MTSRRYATQDDAIDALIIKPIEHGGVASADEFDIDAIARKVLTFVDVGTARAGFECAVDADEFWLIVEQHAR